MLRPVTIHTPRLNQRPGAVTQLHCTHQAAIRIFTTPIRPQKQHLTGCSRIACTRKVYSARSAAAMSDVSDSHAAPSEAAASVMRRPVVTSFVENNKGQVLLVQRSDKVRSYPFMWGGVSGGLEPGDDLLGRAKQEILEEVGISGDQLELVARGRPLRVDANDRHYLVHPFLFKLQQGEGAAADLENPVQLNWENLDYRWVAPDEILYLPTVPRLAATLQRVVLPPYMRHHVTRMIQDRSHGAAELAKHVVAAFQAVECYECGHEQGLTGEEQLELYYDFAYQLATCRPSMAAIANAVVEVLRELDTELCARAEPFEPPSGHVRLSLCNAAEKVMRHLEHLQQDQLANGVAVLGHARQILTLSFSSTILRVLLQAAAGGSGGTGTKPHVVVLESRPLCEGVNLAQQLGEHGIPVSLITDAQAAAFMEGTDAVLVGADALTDDGVINKVGTHLVGLAAQAKGVPVYVLADSMKISPGPVTTAHLQQLSSWMWPEREMQSLPAEQAIPALSSIAPSIAGLTEVAASVTSIPSPEVTTLTSTSSTLVDIAAPQAASPAPAGRSTAVESAAMAFLEEKEPSELQAAWTQYSLTCEAVRVRNLYFEVLPWDLVGAVITDKGVMSVESIKATIAGLRQEYVTVFKI